MDFKNVLMAIVLSTIVLIGWATFFEAPVVEQETAEKKITENQSTSMPSIEEAKTSKSISRKEAINKVDRIKLENKNIKGSISLQGGIIDDIIFKKYKENLKSEENVIFLNPKNSQEGYYIETGWASSGSNNLNLPLDNTIWSIKGNNVLTPGNPINLEWVNNEGLLFNKKIELDDNFLFKITQSIKNNSDKTFQFFSLRPDNKKL